MQTDALSTTCFTQIASRRSFVAAHLANSFARLHFVPPGALCSGSQKETHAAPRCAMLFYPPPKRARERKVGPPLDMRFTCIGCPLPQFGIAISRRSLPTASTSVKKRFESAITLPER
jgi:hypothetical protein